MQNFIFPRDVWEFIRSHQAPWLVLNDDTSDDVVTKELMFCSRKDEKRIEIFTTTWVYHQRQGLEHWIPYGFHIECEKCMKGFIPDSAFIEMEFKSKQYNSIKRQYTIPLKISRTKPNVLAFPSPKYVDRIFGVNDMAFDWTAFISLKFTFSETYADKGYWNPHAQELERHVKFVILRRARWNL